MSLTILWHLFDWILINLIVVVEKGLLISLDFVWGHEVDILGIIIIEKLNSILNWTILIKFKIITLTSNLVVLTVDHT